MAFLHFVLSITLLAGVGQLGFAHIEPLSVSPSNGLGKCGMYQECPGVGGRSVCCPFMNGVCCGNRLFAPMKGFCCPQGYNCGRQGHCTKPTSEPTPKKEESQDLMFHPLTVTTTSPLASVVCPDGKSLCPDGRTCCPLEEGGYGCCAYANAVCCKDRVHCCPQHTICDEESGSCDRSNFFTSPQKHNFFSRFHSKPLRKQPALPLEEKPRAGYIVCPDGDSECDDGQTCCLLQDGSYGCCPLPRAQCCNDGVHCCPENTECDESSTRCLRKESLAALLRQAQKRFEAPSFQVPSSLAAVYKPEPQASMRRCGDGSSMCYDFETCCQFPSGEWGCCPQKDANCCPNGLACCPHGYYCDSTSTHCYPTIFVPGRSRESTSRPTLPVMKLRALTPPKSLICPDGISVCPDDYTCCRLIDSSWGCCPLPKAVCCSDRIHCCPNGYFCNQSAQTCDQSSGSRLFRVPMREKVSSERALSDPPHLQIEARPTRSPPSANSAISNTCQALGLPSCSLDGSAETRCCPFKEGVCCGDGKSCCPTGYSCSGNSRCVLNRKLH